MWQRKQTLFLLAAVILTVVCLCMQIGSYNAAGLDVARVYNLWFTDPLGHRHFDTWPLFAILLPTAALGAYTIFIFRNRSRMVYLLLRCGADRRQQDVGYRRLPAFMASRPACHRPHFLSDGPSCHQCR